MMRRALTLWLFVPLFLSLASAAEKEKPLPKDLPPYGPLKPFVTPKVTPHKLSNGLTLWLVPRPGFPKVSLAVAVRGGKAADPEGSAGAFGAAGRYARSRYQDAQRAADC